jgi:SAM-dependent methyltransferase
MATSSSERTSRGRPGPWGLHGRWLGYFPLRLVARSEPALVGRACRAGHGVGPMVTTALKHMSMPQDLYDERPYTEHAYAETHPSRIAAVARLVRWDAPPVAGARILELGCGRGGNLLPMAAGLPQATFVGIDAAAAAIEEARRIASEAGLANVSFVRARFDEMEIAEGAFDYVICHGVLSWIPAIERAGLLARIGRALRGNGVAYVSFNVLPGWYDRLAARDWLRFSVASLGRPAEDAAASLSWLSAELPPEQADARRRLDAVARRLEETGAAYAFHEYLAPEHHPLLVGAFLQEASAVGLRYLGDAIPATTALDMLSAGARERALSLDPIAAQQLVDFVRHTAFRRTLLVRDEAAVHGPWASSPELDSDAIRSLRMASRLRPREPGDPASRQESFGLGDMVVQISDPATRRALHELARAAPQSLAFDDIARRTLPSDASEAARRALGSELFDLWLATGGLDLYDHELAVRSLAGERPAACPVARWHALHGGVVTNRLHQEVLVPDAIVRWVLGRLDGTRTRRDLVREARRLDATAAATDAELQELVHASVDRLVSCGLVVDG